MARAMTWSSAGGTPGTILLAAGGIAVKCALTSALTVLAGYGLDPVSASWSTQPSE